MPPDPKYRVFTVVMEPFDLPKDEYILDCVLAAIPGGHGRAGAGGSGNGAARLVYRR